MREIFMIFFGLTFILTMSELSSAMMCGSHSEHKYVQVDTDAVIKTATEEPVNVGNKICPVSGDQITEEAKATYEYEGKIYNFCCPMCIEEFKKDPQKYIEKVEEELKGAETTVSPSTGEGHHH